MENEELEKKFREFFTLFPRKKVEAAKKEEIWLRIQNYISQARTAQDELAGSGGFISNFLFLRKRLNRFAMTLLVIIVAMSVVGGGVQASIDSLPGDALYKVKKATEHVENALAVSKETKTNVAIKHAKRRLHEVTRLVEENKPTQVVTQTLEELKTTTQVVVAVSASEPELINKAIELASQEEQILATVEEKVEGKVKEAVKEALSVSRESLIKLTGESPSGVEGAVVDEEQAATTTPKTNLPVRKSKSRSGQDGPIESQIQIHGVIKIEKSSDPREELPEIVPQPTIEF